jgi:hypothetical protein
MNEWQPIETAPKDGRKIVALSEDYPSDPHIVFWRNFPPGSYADGGWQVSALAGRDPVRNMIATHWLPLPEPPT